MAIGFLNFLLAMMINWIIGQWPTIVALIDGSYAGDNGEPYHEVALAALGTLRGQFMNIVNNIFNHMEELIIERNKNYWTNMRHKKYLWWWNEVIDWGCYKNSLLSRFDIVLALEQELVAAHTANGFLFVGKNNLKWNDSYSQTRRAIARATLDVWENTKQQFHPRTAGRQPIQFIFCKKDLIKTSRPELLCELEDNYTITPPQWWKANSV